MCRSCDEAPQFSFSVFAERNSRRDPAGVNSVINAYDREYKKRFKNFERKLIDRLYNTLSSPSITTNAAINPQRHSEFMAWLRRTAKAELLDVVTGIGGNNVGSVPWQNVYIKSAYHRGVKTAVKEFKRAGGTVDPKYIDAVFNKPFHADRVAMAYLQSYDEIQNVTANMVTKIGERVALGIAQGKRTDQIAKDLSEDVKSLGLKRARVITRTSVVRANADGALNTYEQAKVEGVKIKAEFQSIDDNKRCARCEALEGKVYTVAKARGVIPVHPNCRCSWGTVIDDATGKELV